MLPKHSARGAVAENSIQDGEVPAVDVSALDLALRVGLDVERFVVVEYVLGLLRQAVPEHFADVHVVVGPFLVLGLPCSEPEVLPQERQGHLQ